MNNIIINNEYFNRDTFTTHTWTLTLVDSNNSIIEKI